MPIIDADAHVVETEHTWDFMEASDRKYRPVRTPGEGRRGERWLVEGKLRRPTMKVATAQELVALSEKLGRNVATAEAAREMEDVEVRLRHMDELGIDVQVLHSTIFIEQVADSPEAEIAICKGYNRWLADLWRQGKGRLRWSCVLPLTSIPHALEELRFAREHGACAVFMRSIEGERLLPDPYFFPLYEEAERLNTAIAVHIANGNPYMCDLLSRHNALGSAYWKFRLASVGACHAVIMSDVHQRFPGLRFGFLEASAYWVPGMLADAQRRFAAEGRKLSADPLKEFGVYVTLQMNDDIPYLLKTAGEDNFVIGTDYGHTDTSAEIEALRMLRDSRAISPEAATKILDGNPRALYGL